MTLLFTSALLFLASCGQEAQPPRDLTNDTSSHLQVINRDIITGNAIEILEAKEVDGTITLLVDSEFHITDIGGKLIFVDSSGDLVEESISLIFSPDENVIGENGLARWRVASPVHIPWGLLEGHDLSALLGSIRIRATDGGRTIRADYAYNSQMSTVFYTAQIGDASTFVSHLEILRLTPQNLALPCVSSQYGAFTGPTDLAAGEPNGNSTCP